MRSTTYAVAGRDTTGRRHFLGRPTWRHPTGLYRDRAKARQYRHLDDADRAARATAANAALLAEVTVFRVDRLRQGLRVGTRWHEVSTTGTRWTGAPIEVGPATAMMAAVSPTTGKAA